MANKITPFLWFDKNAEEAAKFYVSIFKNAKINKVSRYPEGSGYEPGTASVVDFELDGQRVMLINGGPHFKLDEAFSFSIDCADQAEVDYYWERLLAGGGVESQCGWLKDKFGLSWQVVPAALNGMLKDKDAQKVGRVTQAFLKMKKLDIQGLEKAYRGR